MNICQAGHTKHDRIMVDTVLGKMMVFDAEKYQGQFGLYCTGQDDISMTIKQTGNWARDESPVIQKILEEGNRDNLFIDFGAHIGYYSLMAAQMGYKVLAYEGDAENLDVLASNAKLHHVEDKIVAHPMWIDEKSPLLILEQQVELVKADVEGNEQYVVAMLDEMLKFRRINNLFLEISPTFNKSYPAMVEKLFNYGYRAFNLDGTPFNNEFNFAQTDLVFRRENG